MGGAATDTDSMIDRMILAAIDQLHERRVTRIDMADVARRVGIDLDVARTMFKDEDALDEAIGTFGIARLADEMTRALVAVPIGDDRASLIALARAYIHFALENPKLYCVLTTQVLQPRQTDSIARLYDASFVPLVRRFLGETDCPPSRRAVIARAFLYGFTDLALEDHLELWLPSTGDSEADLMATVEDFVDLLLAAGPGKRTGATKDDAAEAQARPGATATPPRPA